MLSFIFFQVTQAFTNFISTKVWWTVYFGYHCRKSCISWGKKWLPQLTKHKHFTNPFYIVSHQVLKWFKVVCGVSYFITCNIKICTSRFPLLWKHVWENHHKKDLFGSGFSSLSPRLFGTSLWDCVETEHHSESMVKQSWSLHGSHKSREVGNWSEIGCDLQIHGIP